MPSVEERVAYLEGAVGEHTRASASLQHSVADVRTGLTELRTDMNARFDQVDGRFTQIDGRFLQIDGRFAQVEQRLYVAHGDTTGGTARCHRRARRRVLSVKEGFALATAQRSAGTRDQNPGLTVPFSRATSRSVG